MNKPEGPRIVVAVSSERLKAFEPFLCRLKELAKLSPQLALSPAKILLALTEGTPKLIVLDSLLESQGALSILKKMLEINPWPQVAVVSGLSDSEFHETYEGLGLLMRIPDPPSRACADRLAGKFNGLDGQTMRGTKTCI